MAVCDLCKGTGRLLKPWYDTTGLMTGFMGDICFKCDGKGTIEEPLTNEEWFCQLPTEEKAEFFVKIEMSAMHPVKRGAVNMEKFIEEVVEWLKEKHKE